MNILKQLKKEHREVAALFHKIKKAPDASFQKKEKLFQEIALKLGAHAEAEEAVLYARMKRDSNSRDEILEAFEEHGLVKLLLSEIKNLASEDERWMAKLTVLNQLVEHHVEEEESKVFKDARKLFERSELLDFGKQYIVLRNEQMAKHRTVASPIGQLQKKPAVLSKKRAVAAKSTPRPLAQKTAR